MNRGQIRTLASLKAEDQNFTRFTATQYNDSIERAQQQFAMDSQALFKDASTYTVVDGTASYDLPSDFMMEKKVTHKGLKLDPISRATLEFYNRSNDWTDDSGTPKYYAIDPEEARKKLLLYPKPGSADAGANLILTYYPFPATLSGDTSTPLNSSSLMVQFHNAIASYTAWELLGFQKMTPEIKSKRADLLKEYQDKVSEAIETFGNTKSEPLRFRGGRNWK